MNLHYFFMMQHQTYKFSNRLFRVINYYCLQLFTFSYSSIISGLKSCFSALTFTYHWLLQVLYIYIYFLGKELNVWCIIREFIFFYYANKFYSRLASTHEVATVWVTDLPAFVVWSSDHNTILKTSACIYLVIENVGNTVFIMKD